MAIPSSPIHYGILKLLQHKEVRIRKGNFSMNTNTDKKKFIDKYGYDALKIIAAFEEAFEIDDEKRYTTWFGDYNMYETSTDDLSYQKLCKRFFAGLQYLGCGKNKEDVSAICFRRPSEELVEKMKNNRFAEKMRKTTNDRHIEKKAV